jgi:hypothetical protein
VAADHTLGMVTAVSLPHSVRGLVGLEGLVVAVVTAVQTQRKLSMSKGNDKKPKSDKSKPKTGISRYKAAQSTGKPTISPLARKTGR